MEEGSLDALSVKDMQEQFCFISHAVFIREWFSLEVAGAALLLGHLGQGCPSPAALGSSLGENCS